MKSELAKILIYVLIGGAILTGCSFYILVSKEQRVKIQDGEKLLFPEME